MRRGYSEKKYEALQELEKGEPTKDVAAKCNLSETEATTGGVLWKNVFLKISKNF